MKSDQKIIFVVLPRCLTSAQTRKKGTTPLSVALCLTYDGSASYLTATVLSKQNTKEDRLL